ncbi:MAG: M14 family metallopeptidase [Gammaproteobacteria bacterium]|nr:M14 family metallopeptidase [Gammaproteobacteria bacterium]
MLNIYDAIPEGLLDREATDLHEVLPGPSLIHLEGRHKEPLFISLLLHGNEVTGWQAMRSILQKYQDMLLPRAVYLFIGNVQAAKEGLRYLEGQPDYNRIWKAGGEGPEAVMIRQLMEIVAQQKPFASIDLHNNSGRNPHYACINRLDKRFMYLASLFSRTVVYFIKPDTVQSMAFADLCPSVTIECGRPGESHGVEHAVQYIDACLHLTDFPEHEVASHDVDLFHTVAIVKVPSHLSVGLPGEVADICLPSELDQLNFCELQPGAVLGSVAQQTVGTGFLATDESGQDISERYFEIEGSHIQTRLPVMPSMLTLDKTIIKQDCLCYLMERLDTGHIT